MLEDTAGKFFAKKDGVLVEPSVVFPASAVVAAADAASNAIEELSNLVGRNVEPCLCAFPKPIDLSLLAGESCMSVPMMRCQAVLSIPTPFVPIPRTKEDVYHDTHHDIK